MSLTLTLDFGLAVVAEPGLYKAVTSRELTDKGFAADDTSQKGIWRDEPTKTVMLRPLQLREDWLDTSNQLDSIIRLDDLVVNATDSGNQSVMEKPAFGNTSNPWIFHSPVGPAGMFIGDTPGFIGVSTPDVVSGLEVLAHVASTAWNVLTTMPSAASPPTPVAAGGISSSKVVAHSKVRLPTNQALYLRWFHPNAHANYSPLYIFYVGNYAIHIRNVVVQVFRDISHAGDRSAWKKVLTSPMFSTGDTSIVGGGGIFASPQPTEVLAHDRGLLWLPFRRNEILLHSSVGKWAILSVNGEAKRLSDDSDWDITRSDNVQVRVMTSSPGRFQIQKVKYPSGTISIQAPPVMVDYTPPVTPTATVSSDSDHGTTLTATVSGPPSYSIPTNDRDDCPKPVTTATDQRRQYGVVLNFQASADKRWTPYFHAFALTRTRTFGANPATPANVGDKVSDGSHVYSVKFSAGQDAGEGRMTADIWDMDPYPLAARSGRSGFPVQLKDGATVLFTGISEPAETVPLKTGTAAHRITVPALDRWKQLSRGLMRDNRDWTGYGHIDAVRFAAEQGGVDCSAAEFPSGYTQNVINTVNSRFNKTTTLNQDTKHVKHGWAPRDNDTPASFIKRIAELFSGWMVGFRLDGTFFYLPRYYFTTPTVTFAASRTGSSPYYYDPLTFTTFEPEANFIIVKCADPTTGALRYSSAWIDWASILNPNAPNFLGYAKREMVEIGGTFSCTQLNRIARTIWTWTRRRVVQARFDADFVPTLGVGHVCTLGAEGNYRITGFSGSFDNAAHHRVTYTAEFVEAGF